MIGENGSRSLGEFGMRLIKVLLYLGKFTLWKCGV
jgi:hypothetical protein